MIEVTCNLDYNNRKNILVNYTIFIMNNQNLEELEKKAESKYKKHDKKKQRTMKVSGASVRNLQKIIKKKCR